MNPFENYLNDNKNKLKKEAKASADLWGKIENRLIHRRQNQIRILFGIAATLALLIASVTLIKVYFGNNQKNISELPLYSYSKEYGDTEREYAEKIAYEIELVNNNYITKNQKQELESFISGLKALDKAYESYCEIIKEEGCDEIMMELIIDNYKRKLELLQCLQEKLIKINNYEKNNESKQTTLSL